MENNVIEKEAVVNEFMLTLAEAKLLEELSEPHSPDLDLIHNLLCDELPHDTDLVTGILKEGRSIGGALLIMLFSTISQWSIESMGYLEQQCITRKFLSGWLNTSN